LGNLATQLCKRDVLAERALPRSIHRRDDRRLYGLRHSPGPAGYSIADLRCVPARGGQSAGGIYSEACVALVLSGAFVYQSEGRTAVTVPGGLVFANRHETFSCQHQSVEGNRRIVVFFSEKFLEPVVEELGAARRDSGCIGTSFAIDCPGVRSADQDRAASSRQR
jgi:hypothetical protein